ncbi:MAG: stage III sporulation protein AB [Lachnospiraceae bacterium]|nr:stage III sporulation protein AB [Lachnospiraceae bacterium]
MLDLLGSILIIGGMTGLGILYLEKERQQMGELEQFSYLFRLLKSEISFKKQPLPFACRCAGEKIKGEKGRILKEIAGEMDGGSGRSFSQLWKEKWGSFLQTSCLTCEEQQRVVDFSAFVGYEEESMQENMMEHQIEEFRRLAERKREELEKKKRVVMLLCSCIGILFVLILL